MGKTSLPEPATLVNRLEAVENEKAFTLREVNRAFIRVQLCSLDVAYPHSVSPVSDYQGAINQKPWGVIFEWVAKAKIDYCGYWLPSDRHQQPRRPDDRRRGNQPGKGREKASAG